MENLWVHLILSLAPVFVVIPLAQCSLDLTGSDKKLAWLAAGLMIIANTLPASWPAGFLAGLWLLYTIYLLGKAYRKWKKQAARYKAAHLGHLFAFGYLCIGAFWGAADRLAWQPLEFAPVIVLLTAVHFHYAGFCLSWMSSAILRQHTGSKYLRSLAPLAIIGVPLTAVGITGSQLHWSPLTEVITVVLMIVGGVAVALLYLQFAFSAAATPVTSSLWILAGLSLLAGMVLALLYGLRFYFPLPFLSIPWMYSVHGSLNSLGFSMPAVLAWQQYLQGNSVKQQPA